jgi:hypothetical protein
MTMTLDYGLSLSKPRVNVRGLIRPLDTQHWLNCGSLAGYPLSYLSNLRGTLGPLRYLKARTEAYRASQGHLRPPLETKGMYTVLTWIIMVLLSPVLLPLAIIIGILYDPTDTMPMPNSEGKYKDTTKDD